MEYILVILSGILFWFKSNAKIVYGLQWAPWQWWLYTGLLSNYMALYAWWGLMNKYNVWHATAVWVLLNTTAEVILNCIYFEYSTVQILGIIICMIGTIVASL